MSDTVPCPDRHADYSLHCLDAAVADTIYDLCDAICDRVNGVLTIEGTPTFPYIVRPAEGACFDLTEMRKLGDYVESLVASGRLVKYADSGGTELPYPVTQADIDARVACGGFWSSIDDIAVCMDIPAVTSCFWKDSEACKCLDYDMVNGFLLMLHCMKEDMCSPCECPVCADCYALYFCPEPERAIYYLAYETYYLGSRDCSGTPTSYWGFYIYNQAEWDAADKECRDVSEPFPPPGYILSRRIELVAQSTNMCDLVERTLADSTILQAIETMQHPTSYVPGNWYIVVAKDYTTDDCSGDSVHTIIRCAQYVYSTELGAYIFTDGTTLTVLATGCMAMDYTDCSRGVHILSRKADSVWTSTRYPTGWPAGWMCNDLYPCEGWSVPDLEYPYVTRTDLSAYVGKTIRADLYWEHGGQVAWDRCFRVTVYVPVFPGVCMYVCSATELHRLTTTVLSGPYDDCTACEVIP